MKKDSLTIKALTFLLKAGLVYKNDLSLLIYADSTTSNAAKTLSSLIKKKYLNIRKIKIDNQKGYEEAVELTSLGRDELVKILDDEYWKIHKIDAAKRFKSDKTKIILNRLDENTIALMFKVAGAAVFKDEKPSLKRLFFALSDYKDLINEYRIDSYSNKEIIKILDKGIYYTRDEYLNFLKSLEQFNHDLMMKLSKSKFSGIYVNNNSLFVVYKTKRTCSCKVTRANSYIEEYLFNTFTIFEGKTRVYRKIGKRANAPYALFIAGSYSLASCMVVGADYGMYRGRKSYNYFADFRFASKQARKHMMENTSDEKKLCRRKEMFDSMFGVYKHKFVVTRDVSGARSIKYLCNNTTEDWLEKSRELFETNKKYFIKMDDPPLEYAEIVGRYKIPAIYMPVIDVDTLEYFVHQQYSPTIVTYEEMMEVIAHCIRKEITFYDANFYLDGKRTVARKFINDPTYIYDKTGYVKGMKIIKDLIESRGKQEANISEYSHLHELFDYESQKAFYNDIARGKIDPNEVIEKMTLKDKTKKEKKYYFSFTVSNEVFHMFEVLAEKENKTVNQYATDMAIPIIDRDYEEYKANLRMKRKEWKNEI